MGFISIYTTLDDVFLTRLMSKEKKDDIDSHRENIGRVRKQTRQIEYEDDVR